MTAEDCMLALEQMILELPQYRDITNELCNDYISEHVRKEYESKNIATDSDGSDRSYNWDVYDTIPIEVLESILDWFKEKYWNPIEDEDDEDNE